MAIPLFVFEDHNDCDLEFFLVKRDAWLCLKTLSVFSHILYEIHILHIGPDYVESRFFTRDMHLF